MILIISYNSIWLIGLLNQLTTGRHHPVLFWWPWTRAITNFLTHPSVILSVICHINCMFMKSPLLFLTSWFPHLANWIFWRKTFWNHHVFLIDSCFSWWTHPWRIIPLNHIPILGTSSLVPNMSLHLNKKEGLCEVYLIWIWERIHGDIWRFPEIVVPPNHPC